MFAAIIASNNLQGQTVSYSTSVRVASAIAGDVLDVSAQENTPSGIAFNTDGTKVFMSGSTNDNVYEYTLSTPYDLTSGAFVQSFDVLPQESNPTGLTFSRDGFRLFVIGTVTDSIYQYNLSAPFNIATAIYSGQAVFVGNEESSPNGLYLADNGTKIYVTGSTGDNVYQYNLSVSNELNTGTYSGSFLDLSGTLFAPTDVTLNADGSRLFVIGTSSRRVFTYDLATPFDLSTAVQGRKTFNLAPTESSPLGIAIDNTGTKLFITGSGSRSVLSYNLTDNAFVETGANDGTVEGSLIISVSGDSFTNTGMSLSEGTDYTIINLPSGLIPDISVSGSGSNAVLTLSGSAILHDDVHDVDNIMITFNNSALLSGDAAGVINAVSGNSNLKIDFATDIPTAMAYANNPRISSANQSQTFDLSAFSTSPTSVVFSRDGSSMFTVGSVNDMIYQFDLSVNFDVTTASLANQFSVVFEETNPTSVSFNTSGTRMFIMGNSSDLIHELLLDQPYDLSTAYYTGNVFDVSNEELSPEEMVWNNDGTQFFVTGSSGDDVNAYDVSNPFDISTASYSGVSLSVSAFTPAPTSLAFNADGSRLYLAGSSSDRIFTFDLATEFDISTAASAGVTTSLSGFDTSPQGIYLNEDGTKLYMIGNASDQVHEFDLSKNTFIEGGANDGRIEQQMILKLDEELFSGAVGSVLNEGTDYMIDNLPAGLSSVFTINGVGATARVSINGNADAHDNADDVDNLQFTFSNTAFSSGNAAAVSNAVGGSSNLRMDFNPDLSPSIDYSPEIKVSSASFNMDFDISGIETSPTGVTMSPDGSKLFVCGATNDRVYEFTLSVNFDVSTAVQTNELNVAFEETNVAAIQLNPSGTRMYILGSTSDEIHEYVLEVPFDLSSAIYSGAVLDVALQEVTSSAFYISPDGLRVFVIGSSSDAVHQYNLTVPYDFTTASYSGNSSNVSAQTPAPTGITFSTDGLKMLICGSSSDRVFSYDLAAPFDVSTLSLANNTLSLFGFDAAPHDIYIDPSGTRLLMVGTVSDRVQLFDLSNRAFIEKGGNDGTVEGLLNIQLTGDTFANPGTTLIAGTDYTVTNLPAGFTPQLTVSADGLSADLTLSGTATAHDNINDVASIQITYNAATFGNSGTAAIVNAISGNIGIDFAADIPLSVDYALPVETIGDFIAGSGLDISAIAPDPESIVFSNDGSSMYILSNTNDEIYQFDLPTPFVVDGASLVSSFNIFFEESNGSGLAFNETGNRLFFVGTTNDQVHELFLTTPFDLSTAFHTGKRLFVGTQETSPQALEFSNDGLKLFVLGSSSDNVYQYDLINPFDLDGATYSGVLFGLASQTSSPTGLAFNRDGSKMITVGSSSDRMFTYDLSTPFDVSTAAYTEVTRSVSAFETVPQSIYFDKTGSRFYLTGATQNRITPFTLAKNNAFLEKAANDGTVTGSMIISANEELFTNAGGILVDGTDYVIDNLPAGLIPDMQISSDGRTATLTLGGNATANNEANDITDLQFTFSNSAFTGGDAVAINEAVAGGSNLRIDFAEDVNEMVYASTVDATSAINSTNFSVVAEDTNPTAVYFDRSGSKMFMLGNTTDDIYEYSLSTNFDVSTAVLTATFNIGFEENNPGGITFNTNGTRMFVVGSTTDRVREYILDQPFDLTTAYYSGVSADVSAEENSSSGITFSLDGLQMYIVGSSTDNVYTYDLTTPFDIASATSSGSALNISAVTTSPSGIRFNLDGTKLFVSGIISDQLFQYNLTTGFDLSTASLVGSVINFGLQDTAPVDFYLDESGTRLFMIGAGADSVYTYQMTDIAFAEPAANDGAVTGEMLLGIYGDNFANAGSLATDYTIDNLPSGLIPDLLVADDGRTARLTLSGNADGHAGIDDVTDLLFTFNAAAFVVNAATIQNSVGASSGLQIDFFGPAPPTQLLTVEISTTQIDLTWIDQSADEEEFVIFRSTGGNTGFTEIASVGPDVSAYSDVTVSEDNSYFYYVIARNAIGDSSPSNQAAASTLTQPGNALSFDGIDDEVLVPPLNAPTGSFTLEAWVKYEGTGSGFETIIEFGDDNPLFGISAGALTLSGGITAPKQFIRNVWAHIAVSYDLPTQDLRLYINGAEVAQETVSLAFSGQGMGIGHLSGDSHFPGSIDEVRIWEVSRSAAEIGGAFTSGLAGNESGLLAYYKFDQTVSGFDLLPDRSINSFDGTLTNFDFNGIDNGSDWVTSEALTVVIPGAPTALAATDITSMDFTANWELEPGIINYVIDVSEDDQFTELVTGFENQPVGDVNTTMVTGLEYGTSYFYRLRGVICPGDTTIYSDTIAVKTIIDAGTVADSIVLVKIYDALGGENWTDNSNWTVADQRIETWNGVTLTAGRVTAINLSDNNLVGGFPTLATGELDQLVTLLLNGNAIENLPDLRDLTALTDLQVQDNFLSFDDLEPNSSISGIMYSPQGILLEEEDFLFNEGEAVVLDRTVGGSNNVYEWRKDDAVLAGETSSTLSINTISFEDEGFYEAFVTNVSVPGLILTTSPITITISSLEKDSLALVAIYNATGGNDAANPWTGRDNWLNTNITQWEGLGFTGNRVTSVDLSGSNLRGTIPEGVLDILNLETLILNDNLLDSIPDLTGLSNLTTLDVRNNLLEFDDLEANATITNFDFAGQEIPGTQNTVIRERGSEVTFSVDVRGEENVYQWQFDGVNITGATESTYVIPDLSFDDMGVYRCIISNNLITPLDLITPGDSLLATADVSGTVRGVNSTPIASGTVLALRITDTNTAYDSITPVVDVVNGVFTYPDLVLADYLFVVEADESIYIPTYVESGFLWDEADTVFLRDNGQSVTVDMVLDPDATVGPGAVGGIFEEDIPDDGRIEARRRVRRVGVALRRRRSSNRILEDEFELIAYTQTDDNGQFSFQDLPTGVYRISFEFPGVPLDENSFVEFEISEDDGQTSLELEAVATEDGTIVVTAIDITSIGSLVINEELIYPNPVRQLITVDYSKVKASIKAIKLMDSSGRAVLVQELTQSNLSKAVINLSELNEGVYILQLIDANNQSVATSRIIKQ